MMIPAGKVGLAVAGGALIAGGAVYFGGSGAQQSSGDAAVSIALQAAPREIDEGDFVEFVAALADSEEAGFAFHNYEWDYGDGSPRTAGQQLAAVRHRFVDNGSPQVAVMVGDERATIGVRVRNVPPTIRSLTTLAPTRRGDPVTFEVTATDPGLRDRLSYTWSFGDGNELRGTSASVTHRYDTPGFYTAEVLVEDGDGGRARRAVQVLAQATFGVHLSGEVNGTIVGGDDERPRAMLLYHRPLRTPDAGLFVDGPAKATATPQREGCFLTIEMAKQEAGQQQRFAIGSEVHDSLIPGAYPVLPTANIWPACATPGMRCPARHALVTGTVTLTRVGLDGIEGHANLATEFSPGSATRMTAAFATGPVFRGDGRCTIEESVETFDVASRTPAVDAQNVDPAKPALELTFTRPVNPATVAQSMRLEYGRPSGGPLLEPLSYQAVPGAWEMVPGEDHSIRFVPQARLLDGVIHCVRVRTGPNGLRGRRGEVLAVGQPMWADRNRPACEASRPWPGAREWAFSTLVELESVRLHLYQSSIVLPVGPEEAPSQWLVAGKPSVARVYPHWTEKENRNPNGVNAWSQVKSFPARVLVRLGQRPISAPRRADIRRPDQFDENDRRHARHSVNLFGWRPTAQRLRGLEGGRPDARARARPCTGRRRRRVHNPELSRGRDAGTAEGGPEHLRPRAGGRHACLPGLAWMGEVSLLQPRDTCAAGRSQTRREPAIRRRP